MVMLGEPFVRSLAVTSNLAAFVAGVLVGMITLYFQYRLARQQLEQQAERESRSQQIIRDALCRLGQSGDHSHYMRLLLDSLRAHREALQREQDAVVRALQATSEQSRALIALVRDARRAPCPTCVATDQPSADGLLADRREPTYYPALHARILLSQLLFLSEEVARVKAAIWHSLQSPDQLTLWGTRRGRDPSRDKLDDRRVH